MVVDEDVSLSKAAKHLKLNVSTAKMIVKTFKEKGKIFEKKTTKPKKKNIETQE